MAGSTAGGGTRVLSRMNRKTVLDAVRTAADGISVTALAEQTGLSRPAVTRALTDLSEIGLVERHDWTTPPPGRIGRPAQQVRFRADLGFVAGVEVGPHRIRLILADLLGQPIDRHEIDVADTGAAVAESATRIIETRASAAGLDLDRLWAITVGTPGIVDVETGEIHLAPSIPGWAGLPIVARLRQRYGCPVLIENDTNLAALAERSHGDVGDCADYAYVHWDERVGTGLVIDGKPYRGAASAAGELGFVDVLGDRGAADPPSDLTGSDGSGRFERLVNTPAIKTLALERCAAEADQDLSERLERTDPHEVARVLFEAARSGDRVARDICARATARFSTGLAVLLTLLDPDTVVLGGAVAQAGDDLLAAIRTDLDARLLRSPPRLLLSHLGDDAVALGAIQFALGTVERRLADLAAERQPPAPVESTATGA